MTQELDLDITPKTPEFEVGSYKGSIEVIVGSMFSGKSDELIRRVRRVQIAINTLVSRGLLDEDLAGEIVRVFKPTIDTRYEADKVNSHTGSSCDAILIEPDISRDMLGHITENTKVVAVDEAQFFEVDLVPLCHNLADRGIRVIVAGLDTNFRGETFGHMGDLIAQADSVDKLAAVCMVCGDNNATRTQRIIVEAKDGQTTRRPAAYDDPLIVVGATDQYEARCRRCHEVTPSKSRTFTLPSPEESAKVLEQVCDRSEDIARIILEFESAHDVQLLIDRLEAVGDRISGSRELVMNQLCTSVTDKFQACGSSGFTLIIRYAGNMGIIAEENHRGERLNAKSCLIQILTAS